MSTILLLSSLLDAQAAGFTLAGEGTRPMGRAGAAVVGVDDLSAIRTNPAAVIRFARPQVNLQLAAAHQRVRFTRSGEAPVSNEAGPQLIPNLGYANGIIPGKLSFAVGLVSPLGAPLAYPEDGPQRFTQVESTLRSGEVGAVLAWRPIEGLSVGAGVSWTFLWLEQSLVSHVNPSTFTPTEDPQFDVLTTAQVQDFQQLTGRIGALWDRGAWAVGASVAPPIRFFATGSLTADFSANVYFTGDEDTDAIITAQAATDSSVSLPLTLPAVVRLGGMVRRDSGLQVELNVVWQGWSSVERLQLEDVDLEIETTAAEPSQVAEDVPLPIGMRDAWGVHLGSEYPLRPTARIRGGVFAETSAAAEGYASVLLPDGPKLGYGLGGSIQPWPERGLWIDLGFGQGIVFRQSIETSRVTQIQIDPLTGAVREGLVVGRGDLGVLNTTASVAMSWTL